MGNTMADNPGVEDTPGDNMPDVGNETPAYIPLSTKPAQMPAGSQPPSQPQVMPMPGMIPGGTPMGMGMGAPGGANMMGGVA